MGGGHEGNPEVHEIGVHGVDVETEDWGLEGEGLAEGTGGILGVRDEVIIDASSAARYYVAQLVGGVEEAEPGLKVRPRGCYLVTCGIVWVY